VSLEGLISLIISGPALRFLQTGSMFNDMQSTNVQGQSLPHEMGRG
jgi:hypothetical protein